MNKNLESFKSEQARLLTAYNRLPELGEYWLKAADITAAQIEQWRSELQANRFKLCVAGQMNSGKSTLINALLFGRIVLPVLDTVMTSTITLIEHQSQHPSGKEGAKIEFYNQNEWANIRQQLEANAAHAEKFTTAVTDARNIGVLSAEIIGSTPHILDGFDGLDEYIAPMEKGGRYTPFVRQVTVYVDHPLLKDLAVVDTPGINDPNQIRAKLTEDWMRQADAVLYVTYAGQPMSAPDVDFINHFMIHVASSHRLVAINKIDMPGMDETQLIQWLEDMRKSESEGIKQIFSSSTPTILVSALAGLLENSTVPLDDDLKWYQDKLRAKGFLDPDRNGMAKLKAAIESRLVQNKGESLLVAHQAKVNGVCLIVDNAIRLELESLKQKLLDTSQSHERLEQERVCVMESTNQVEKLNSKFRDTVASSSQTFFQTLQIKVLDIRRNAANEAETKLSSKNSTSAVVKNATFVANDEMESSCIQLARFVEVKWGDFQADILRNMEVLKTDLAKITGMGILSVELIIDRAKIVALGDVELNHAGLDKRDLNKAAQEAQGSIARLLNKFFATSLDKEAVIAAISEEMQNKINKVLKERIEEAKKIINNSLDSFKTLVEEQINKLNELREKNIVLILRQRKGIQGTVKTMNTEKNQLEVELSRVTQLINSFKQ
jgi:hypothetical protein